MPTFFSVFFTLILLFFPSFVQAQTPTAASSRSYQSYVQPPWPHPFNFPCASTTGGGSEFHPLRPYPGNPCDPLIPKKDPEAPLSVDPENKYITYKCAKSLNVVGTTPADDVMNICNMDIMPANPLADAEIRQQLDADGRTDYFRCSNDHNAVCFVQRITWNTHFDLSSVELPFSGNTQDELVDADKVNGYLSWYLNGTVYQSSQQPLIHYENDDRKQITTFSGPLNKLYPKEFRDPLKVTMAETGPGSMYHNYLVACQRNIDAAYIINALREVIRFFFNALVTSPLAMANLIFDLAEHDISRLWMVGRALIRSAFLPEDDFTAANVALVFAQIGINRSVDVFSTFIELGQSNLARLGQVIEAFRTDLAESCATSNTRRRLNSVDENDDWIMRYVPFSSLEDTTGEFTVSLIPSLQPTDINGQILSMSLTINTGSDSRLYFPHLRAAIALSSLANALHTPVGIPTTPIPSQSFNTFGCIYNPSTYSCSVNPVTNNCGPGYTTYDACSPHSSSALDCSNSNPHWCIPTGPTPTAVPPSNTFDCVYQTSTSVCSVNPNATNCGPGYTSYDACTVHSGSPQDCANSNPHWCIPTSSVSPAPTRRPTGIPIEYRSGLSYDDPDLVSQRITEHQGIADSTIVQGEDDRNPGVPVYNAQDVAGQIGYLRIYSEGHLIRNTSVREGQPAPTPLYVPLDALCDIDDTRTNEADSLIGQEVNATLTYYQLFQYTPQLVIDCNCNPPRGNCRDRGSCVEEGNECDGIGTGDCCWGTCPPGVFTCTFTDPNYATVCSAIGNETDCNAQQPYCAWEPHTLGSCPSWPTIDLRSAARVHPFTETPLIEKVYDLLVTNPQSLLKRWLPKLPLSASSSWSLKSGRENTVPATSVSTYTAATNDLDNTSYTAGEGGSGALYFPHVGSLADNILGLPNPDNLNLQRLLRPRGFVGWTTGSASQSAAGINCNVSIGEQNAACVNRDNYIRIAEDWTSMPEGTHAALCYNDVVFRAGEAGVNPGLALLIWLNESDSSNYLWATPVEDFGIHVGPYSTPNNFDQQITGFLQTVNAYRSMCASAISTYGGARVFAAMFLVGNSCIPTAASDVYANGLIQKWGWIGGSCAFPFP